MTTRGRGLDYLGVKVPGTFTIRGIYVLTANVDINVARVSAREALGGHWVPENKRSK